MLHSAFAYLTNLLFSYRHSEINDSLKSEKYSSNWELSTARATSVINYLVNSKRVNPKRLSAVGYGEYAPVAENTSNDGRMKNRRVDMIILDNNKTGD